MIGGYDFPRFFEVQYFIIFEFSFIKILNSLLIILQKQGFLLSTQAKNQKKKMVEAKSADDIAAERLRDEFD